MHTGPPLDIITVPPLRPSPYDTVDQHLQNGNPSNDFLKENLHLVLKWVLTEKHTQAENLNWWFCHLGSSVTGHFCQPHPHQIWLDVHSAHKLVTHQSPLSRTFIQLGNFPMIFLPYISYYIVLDTFLCLVNYLSSGKRERINHHDWGSRVFGPQKLRLLFINWLGQGEF